MTLSAAQWDERPFPALTAAQRLHLDVFGYVVIERAVDADRTAALRDRIYELEERFRAEGTPPDGARTLVSATPEYFRVDNLPHLDPVFLDYLTDPLLVAMAEEAIGGEARLEQSDAHIRRPPADPSQQRPDFHRGSFPGFGSVENGLYHYPFVKTLTNLTDLGPEDGGTMVIPGTHKMGACDPRAVIAAAEADPKLLHQVVAPAGSTLLFFESLLHSSGIIRSGRDRLLVIGGYTPTMFQAWEGYDPDPEFLESVDESYRPLLAGTRRWSWSSRFRTLDAPDHR